MRFIIPPILVTSFIEFIIEIINLIGIFIVSKAINYLLEKKKTFIYSIINGFFLSSMFYLVIETIKLNYTFIDILFSIPLIFLSYKIGSLSKK